MSSSDARSLRLPTKTILIVGSGHATHNLRDWMSNPRRREPLRYAQAFADWLHERLEAGDTDALIAYREQAPEAARAHPTEEHLLPLFVAWGAAGEGARVERLSTGFDGGALANDSYRFHPPRTRAVTRALAGPQPSTASNPAASRSERLSGPAIIAANCRASAGSRAAAVTATE